MGEHTRVISNLVSEKISRITPIATPLLGGALYRINCESNSYVARVAMSKEEFFYQTVFTKQFLHDGIPVPKIYVKDESSHSLLLEDLGNEALIDVLQKEGESSRVVRLYEQALVNLVRMQLQSSKPLFKHQEVIAYDTDKMRLDINYFFDGFVAGRQVDTVLLRKECEELLTSLGKHAPSYFYYRDLMTRNVMVHKDVPYFIDFVGGRPGFIGYLSSSLHPPVVSLVHHPRANLSKKTRRHLLSFYIDVLSNDVKLNSDVFLAEIEEFRLLKGLQLLGTYGALGIKKGEKKFRSQIKRVLEELDDVQEVLLRLSMSELQQMVQNEMSLWS